MKIVFLDSSTLGDTSLAPIERLGDLTLYPTSTHQEALERVAGYDVVITNKVVIDKELLDRAADLRLVCEAATGVNNIDVDECSRRGIQVRNVAGYSTQAVVQITFMHILSLMGNAPYFDGRVKDFTYSKGPIFTDLSAPFYELSGKTLGIIGMGNIGKRVAQVGEAFGMKVVYFSTSGTSHCKDYPSLPLEDLLSRSDVVSIHAPLNERTAGLISDKEFSLMKRSAIIVNAGRGGIIEESALARAIDNGAIAGAALDVYVKEPLPEDNPLLHTSHPERLRFTPHTAWASVEARERLVEAVAQNIAKGF